MNAHDGITYYSQMPIDWRVGKEHVVYLYNRILLDHRKWRHTDTYYKMNEPWKHYAKWNKQPSQETTHYILSRIGTLITETGGEGK